MKAYCSQLIFRILFNSRLKDKKKANITAGFVRQVYE